MHNFNEATEITISTYQQIASVYAEAHKFPLQPDFWRERLQRFIHALRNSPAYQANPSLPVLDMGEIRSSSPRRVLPCWLQTFQRQCLKRQ